MGKTDPEGRITRRGFLERGSAALASAGLIRNAYTAKAAPSSEGTGDSAKPDAMRLTGKIALEEHFVLAETMDTSYAVRDLPPETRNKILDLGSGRIAEMDRGGLDICILSLTAPGEPSRFPSAKKSCFGGTVPTLSSLRAKCPRLAGFLAQS
jgi:hypothetical protein